VVQRIGIKPNPDKVIGIKPNPDEFYVVPSKTRFWANVFSNGVGHHAR
jgi:hypothetical protein